MGIDQWEWEGMRILIVFPHAVAYWVVIMIKQYITNLTKRHQKLQTILKVVIISFHTGRETSYCAVTFSSTKFSDKKPITTAAIIKISELTRNSANIL